MQNAPSWACSMSTLDNGVDLRINGWETKQGDMVSSRVSPDLL